MKKIFAIAALAGMSASAAASELSYTYVELAYQDVSFDLGAGYEADGDAFGLNGSYAIGTNWFVLADYNSLDADFSEAGVTVEAGQDVLGLGFGGYWGIADNTDFVASLSFVDADVDATITINDPILGNVSVGEEDSDSGYRARVGLRSLVATSVELFGHIGYIDIFDDSETSYQLGGRYLFNDKFSLSLSYETADDVDAIGLAGRVQF